MFAEMSTGDHINERVYPRPVRRGHPKRSVENTHVADARAGPIGKVLIVLSATESHRHVALRAQLLTSDIPVSRAVLLEPSVSNWQRIVERMRRVRDGVVGLTTDVSARVLRTSVAAGETRLETDAHRDDILRHAEISDLVVVGRRKKLSSLLGSLAPYVRRLLRRSRTPLLVVGSAPCKPYRNVVIATDLETDVAPALRWARQVAPKAAVTFVHVYRGVFESKLQWAGVPEPEILEHRREAQRNASSALSSLLRRHGFVGGGVLVHGWGIHDVLSKAHELGADLIVVVKSTHSWWAEVLGVSASVEIATHADADVLVVHGAPCSAVRDGAEREEWRIR